MPSDTAYDPARVLEAAIRLSHCSIDDFKPGRWNAARGKIIYAVKHITGLPWRVVGALVDITENQARTAAGNWAGKVKPGGLDVWIRKVKNETIGARR